MYQIREHSSIDFLNYLKGVTLRDTHIRKEKKKQWALPWWSSAFTAGGMGLIPGRGTKIPHAKRRGQKKKKERKRKKNLLLPLPSTIVHKKFFSCCQITVYCVRGKLKG